MTTSPDWIVKTTEELRGIGEALRRISGRLHEHTHKLEIAVEGTYVRESGDPRVKLLGEALRVSSQSEVELGIQAKTLLDVLQAVPQHNGNAQADFELERQALTTSITNLRQERTEQETLYEIARALNSTLEFDEVLRLVMDLVISFVNAERGFLMLVNPVTDELEFTIARDRYGSIPESAFQISRGTVMRVIKERKPELLCDDEQFSGAVSRSESIVAFGILSIMCAPLIVRDRCIGAVYVDSRMMAKLFIPRHLDLLQAFCNQAAIALENARLFAQVREDKEYMDNIFASIANGVITVDPNGIIKTFNNAASRILLLDRAAVIGKHYEEVFSALPQLGVTRLLQQALLRKEQGLLTSSVGCEIPGRQGVSHLILHATSLRDTQGSGTHLGTALVVDDETELRNSKERAKEIRSIFERYVHPNVVQVLMKNPMALNLGGETKEISVVFADIRGYTSLSERMAPEEVMNLINRYLKIMCEAIWEEEGTLTAFQGDALMAIFNAPLNQKVHPLHAVRAAWKMRAAVETYQQTLTKEARVSFGIGVNTGLATVGNVGSQARMQNYTAIGDVVNVASRIQNYAADNNILLHEKTFLQVYRYVNVKEPQLITVKNKAEPQTVYYLSGLK